MSNKQTRILQFKITLKHIKPPIWRRFLTAGNINFVELHDIIQWVMGWGYDHLYSFDFPNTGQLSIGDPEGFDLNGEDIQIDRAFRKEKDSCIYTYDFGDNWEHTLVLEKILEVDPDKKYPYVLAGKRNCPPEDCGGWPGYYNLLDVLSNPKDPEYEDMIDWIGEDYDPEYFNIDELNS